MRLLLLASAIFLSMATGPFAGEADIVDVKVRAAGNGAYNFDVTLRHADEGWKHYANKWEIVGPDGKILGTRVLAHPHVNEQPFTRSLYGVQIPANVRSVTIRAYDSVHGAGGAEKAVSITR